MKNKNVITLWMFISNADRKLLKFHARLKGMTNKEADKHSKKNNYLIISASIDLNDKMLTKKKEKSIITSIVKHGYEELNKAIKRKNGNYPRSKTVR